jgi:hypothetical protein
VSYSFNPSLHRTSLVGTFPPNEGANYFISVYQEFRDAPNSNGATHAYPAAQTGEKFKELSSVVANQRQRVKIVETGEVIELTAPDQVLISGVLQSGAVASLHLKCGTANRTVFLFEVYGT